MMCLFCSQTMGKQQTSGARNYGKKNNSHPEFPNMDLTSLPVPLLHTRFGNLKAPLHSTQPRKGCILQIWPVIVICHLQYMIKQKKVRIGKMKLSSTMNTCIS